MSAPIPADIESCEQFQVRHEGLSGNEVVRTGNLGQMTYLWRQRREFGAVIEKRQITVGAWEAFDPDARAGEEDCQHRWEYGDGIRTCLGCEEAQGAG